LELNINCQIPKTASFPVLPIYPGRKLSMDISRKNEERRA